MAEASDQASHPRPDVDVRTATAADLQELLNEGRIESKDLVDLYLHQIQSQNHRGLKLNAKISTTPREILLAIADTLDEERAAGKVRGPLHGIPVLVKDNICTDRSFGIATTCGAHALVGAWPKGNASIVDLVVIGKANLSEMAGWKGFGIRTGWSALGGQTHSPYIVGGDAKSEKLLSQTVSAVIVPHFSKKISHTNSMKDSSSFIFWKCSGSSSRIRATHLGHRTDGSITQPANRAALYGFKLTVGSVSTEGTAP